MLNFEESGCLHLNKPLWFVFQARLGVIVPLHTLLPLGRSGCSGRSWGSPLAPPMRCGAGGSSDPSQGRSWAEAAECLQQSLSRDLVLPNPIPPAPAAGISPSGSADPPWALSCPALPTKGQRWWPPACTWLDLSAVLSGGSGWLWPRPPTTGW